MIDLLLANLQRIVIVPTASGTTKGRLIRVGRVRDEVFVDIKTKKGVKSLRIS